MMKAFAIAGLLTALTFSAQAQETQTTSSTFPKPTQTDYNTQAPHVGLLAGTTSPDGSYASTGSLGFDAGFQPYIPFGVGAEVAYSNSNGEGNNEDLERTQVLAKASYNFGGNVTLIKHSYIGLGAGVVFEDEDVDLVSVPMIGFDIPLKQATADYVSLGANARYALVEGSAPDAFAINAAVKYWY